jgi:hypothetical protein
VREIPAGTGEATTTLLRSAARRQLL